MADFELVEFNRLTVELLALLGHSLGATANLRCPSRQDRFLLSQIGVEILELLTPITELLKALFELEFFAACRALLEGKIFELLLQALLGFNKSFLFLGEITASVLGPASFELDRFEFGGCARVRIRGLGNAVLERADLVLQRDRKIGQLCLLSVELAEFEI